MIARAPLGADVLGIVALTAGPDEHTVKWTGWAEVWAHPTRGRIAAFPSMWSIRDVREPVTKMLHVRIQKASFRPARPDSGDVDGTWVRCACKAVRG